MRSSRLRAVAGPPCGRLIPRMKREKTAGSVAARWELDSLGQAKLSETGFRRSSAMRG